MIRLAAEEAPKRRAALSPTWHQRLRDWVRSWHPRIRFALGTALVLLIGLEAVSIGRFRSGTKPLQISIGTVTDEAEAMWAAASPHPKVGDALRRGTLQLDSGVVELTFGLSAKVAIEGPARFKLTDGASLELFEGKISAQVPREARGFKVRIPSATVKDLGTRFGVIINSEGTSEVDVFQGHVELFTDASKGREAKWRLAQGMAMIADARGAVAATALPEAAFPQPNLAVLARPQNCGFDVSARAALGGIPTDFGYWSGPAYSLTRPVSGIQPASGPGMLRFHERAAGPGSDSEVWQLVDLKPFKKLLAGGLVEANLSALYNRVHCDATAGSRFGLTLAAFRGVPANPGWLWARRETAALALADKELATDDHPATWEKLELNVKLPADADFLIIGIRAVSVQPTSGSVPLFPGHFADLVDLKLCTPLRASTIATGR